MTNTERTALADVQALISALEYPYLLAVQTFLGEELDKRKKTAKSEAMAKINQICADLGISPAEILGSVKPAKLVKPVKHVAAKYQHPTDSSLHWSGRGRKPLWVELWIRENGNLDAVMVNPEAEVKAA